LRPRIDQLESRLLLTATPLAVHPTFEIGPSVGGGGPDGGYTPAQIQVAYGFNNITFGDVVGNGSGETIAIVDAYDDPNIQADLNTFDTKFDLPATTVTRVNEFGGTSYPASDPTGDWELEESLDVEWAHAMAPGASIMLVEASSPSYVDLLTAVSYGASQANVVSMSWDRPGSDFVCCLFLQEGLLDRSNVLREGPTGPGRPGWLPTQVPHRSGLAHHAHPVPHLMNSRPARSVVGTWTWFRSRCTCQVSLQRLMRRHPLPSTGSLGVGSPASTVV
jgi:hypothetical protein